MQTEYIKQIFMGIANYLMISLNQMCSMVLKSILHRYFLIAKH